MELRHLRYFVVMAEEENIIRASERLHVAASALSRRMQDLERDLGVQLFERGRGRLRLSAPGRVYFEDIKRILADLERAGANSRRAAQGEIGTLGIGFLEVALQHPTIFGALQTFRARHSDVNLKLVQRRPLVDTLMHGLVDAVIVMAQSPFDETYCEHIEIAKDNTVVVIPMDHPLAKYDEITPSDLVDQPFVWMDPYAERFWFDRILSACRNQGLELTITQYVTSQTVRLHLVSVGMGLTFAPASSEFPANVVAKPVKNLSLPIAWDLIWRREHRTPVLDRLIAIVEERRAATGQLAATPSSLDHPSGAGLSGTIPDL